MRWANWLRRPSPSARRARLTVQPLEDRTVPSGANTPFPQVGDRVWKDLNANGFQDAGEPGLAFVTLQLYQGNTLVGTTTTDGTGAYAFNRWNVTNGTIDPADDGLKPNTVYQIRIDGTQPALVGLRPTAANQGTGPTDDQRDSDLVPAGTGGVIDLVTGTDDLYRQYDAGYVAAATIGNQVFFDANNNGRKDVWEAGIAGVTVRLLDSAGTSQVAATVTGPDGSYQFTGLAPGTYIVEIAANNFTTGGSLVGYASSTGKPGQSGTAQAAGAPDPNKVKADGTSVGFEANGVVRCKGVTVGGPVLTNKAVDFGFFRATTVTGRVFVDRNGNGRIDPEDTTGLAGIKVRAAGPAGVFTATTDGTGTYQVPNLPAGTYTVVQTTQPAGYKSTTPNLVTTTLGVGSSATIDFGEAPQVDLKVSVGASPQVVNPGGTVTLTYRVKNQGTADATGVTLWAQVPAGYTVLKTDATGLTYDPQTGQGTIGNLAAGAEAVLVLRLQSTQVGTVWARAQVQGVEAEDNGLNNAAGLILASAPPAPAQPVLNLPFWLAGFWR